MKNKKVLLLIGVAIVLVGGIIGYASVKEKEPKVKVQITETSTVERVKQSSSVSDSEDEKKEEKFSEEKKEETEKEEPSEDDGTDANGVKPTYSTWQQGVSDNDNTDRTGGLTKQEIDNLSNLTEEQKELSNRGASSKQSGDPNS